MTVDEVTSYFGLRTVRIDGLAITLNGKPVFQRLILDQGFYPDGIWTAPSDEALRRDIELSQAMGFNGARLHQKVFEPRFLYWADRLGYLVWGEFPSWGLDLARGEALDRFLREWVEVLDRDYATRRSSAGARSTRRTTARTRRSCAPSTEPPRRSTRRGR